MFLCVCACVLCPHFSLSLSLPPFRPASLPVFFARALSLCVHQLQMKAEFCKYRASQQCAACIMTTLRIHPHVKHVDIELPSCSMLMSDWSPRLTYYTTYQRHNVSHIADNIITAATHLSKNIILSLNPQPDAVDKHVGSFNKRYTADFLQSVDAALTAYGQIDECHKTPQQHTGAASGASAQAAVNPN